MRKKESFIFLAPGFEETEAIVTIDALRRAHIPITAVAVSDTLIIKGSTELSVIADLILSEANFDKADWLILPGGDPGAWNLCANKKLNEILLSHYKKGGCFAAICASPAIVLAPLGIIKDKPATCYPFMSDLITENGGIYQNKKVVSVPGLITSQGPGTTLKFAIEIIRAIKGNKMADGVADAMLVN